MYVNRNCRIKYNNLAYHFNVTLPFLWFITLPTFSLAQVVINQTKSVCHKYDYDGFTIGYNYHIRSLEDQFGIPLVAVAEGLDTKQVFLESFEGNANKNIKRNQSGYLFSVIDKMTQTYQLSDLNGGNYPAENGRRESGCYVSTITGFVLVLVAVLISVGVGLVVHLAGPGEVICHCHSDSDHGGVTDGQGGIAPTTPPTVDDNATILAKCIQWAENGNSEICSACGRAPTTTPSTTVPPTVTSNITYRLPSNTKPYHYNVDLQPNMYSKDPDDFNFNGTVKIWIMCLDISDEITLHAYRLFIDYSSIEIHGEFGNQNLYESYRNDTIRQFLILKLKENMEPHQNYTIFMKFSGPLQGDGTGLYLSSYIDEDKTIYLATTQFEAPYARRAFPCYDEPALKATFNVTLRKKLNTGRNYITLSNMNIIQNSTSGDYGVDVYATSVVMPTYLLAFIVCDYHYLEDISDTNLPYRTYAKPSGIEHAVVAQNHGIKIFNRYEEYFNPDYSLPKIDNIAIPDFNSGAMENWGLITYREGLLYVNGSSRASDEKWIAEVISHEIAHQWFGNLVSPKWWKWLWLNEAFASFWDYHIVGELYPNWRSLDLSVVNERYAIMVTDALRSSHPMSWDVESNSEISSIFDGITYNKGSCIVRMMHFIMGQDNFIDGLNLYLDAFQYDVAEHQDLWDKLNEASQNHDEILNMTYLMDPWVTQENYPVVTVKRTSSGFELSQKRFLIGTTDEEAANDTALYGYKWPIPISYTRKSSVNFVPSRHNVIIMNINESTVTLTTSSDNADDWIMINLQQHGYYRVNYEEDNWNALINQLIDDHTIIHPINRAQIINDASNNAKAGLLKTSIALRTLNYLAKETDYLPWAAFSREMGYVDDMLERTDLYGDFNARMKSMVEGPLESLGFNITDSMEHIDIFAVALLASYACDHGVESCIDTAQNQFNDWKVNDANTINPNLRLTFYCTAIKFGGYEEWNFVYEKYMNEQETAQKGDLRRALACSKIPSLLQRVLDMSLNPDEVRPQDMRTTIVYVAQNPIGVDLAWNFFRTKWTELQARLSANNLSRLLSSVTSKFNTQFYLDQIQEMVNKGQTGSIPNSFTSAIENTKVNMAWLEENYDTYKNWLESPSLFSM